MIRLLKYSLIGVSLALTAGCYTLLKHPATLAKNGFDTTDFQNPHACGQCHVESESFYYGYRTGYYRDYYAAWDAYYARPWWHDAYWTEEEWERADQNGAAGIRSPQDDRGGFYMGGSTIPGVSQQPASAAPATKPAATEETKTKKATDDRSTEQQTKGAENAGSGKATKTPAPTTPPPDPNQPK